MKNKEKEYRKDHKLAKLICFLINTILFIIYFNLTNTVLQYILFITVNFTYFFGVNTIGYIIESIKHHKHKHEVL